MKEPTLQILNLILMDFMVNGDKDNNIWVIVFDFLTVPERKVFAQIKP